MAKTKEQKIEAVKKLEDLFKKAKSVVMVDYYGLKVKEINQLRKILKKMKCRYLVTKKTLLKHILDKLELKDVDLNKLTGGLGLIFGLEDEICPIKLTVQFRKDHEKIKIHGGIFDKTFINLERIEELSKLPSKEQLQARLVWVIKLPLAGLANVLRGNLQNLVCVLRAVQSKKS